MNTADRLRGYYPFSDEVIETVSEIADSDRGLSYGDFTAKHCVPDVKIYYPDHGKPIQVLDIIPNDYDGTIVYHESMGTSIDENSIMHVTPLSLALPTKRIIAVGNSGRPGQGYGKLSSRDAFSVLSGNLRPVVDPTLEYLASQGVEHVAHVGYSYGSEKSVAATLFSENYGLSSPFTISIDPPAVENRGMLALAKAFSRSGESMQSYVEASGSKALIEARQISGGLFGIAAGLIRLSNLAISHVIAFEGFEARSKLMLINSPELAFNVQWGSESEITIDGLMFGIRNRLVKDFGDRVSSARYEGQKHAMCDDIYFHAATILHGIEQAAYCC